MEPIPFSALAECQCLLDVLSLKRLFDSTHPKLVADVTLVPQRYMVPSTTKARNKFESATVRARPLNTAPADALPARSYGMVALESPRVQFIEQRVKQHADAVGPTPGSGSPRGSASVGAGSWQGGGLGDAREATVERALRLLHV